MGISLIGNYVWEVVSCRNQVRRKATIGKVMVTSKAGKKYHKKSCSHLYLSGNPRENIVFEPCSDCRAGEVNVYGPGPQDYTACRWTCCLAMLVCVMVFEIGVFAGKSRAFKEDLTFALEEVKNEFKNVPQLEYVNISQKLAPVIALTQEEPNMHYNLKPKEVQRKKYYTIMENLEEKLQYLVNSVEIAKEEFEALKDMFFIRSLEPCYAPVITVKFHYILQFMKYVFEGRAWFQQLLLLSTTAPGMIVLVSLSYLCQKKHLSLTGSRATKRRKRPSLCENRKSHKALLMCVLLYSNLEVAAGMEQALQTLAAQTAASAQQIQQMTEAIRQSAKSSSDRTQGMANLFERLAQTGEQREQNLVGALQNVLQQSRSDMALSQEALSSRIKEVFEQSREKGEIQLHKLVKAPEAFSPSTWQEERNSFGDFKHRLRTWLGAVDTDIPQLMDKAEKDPEKEFKFSSLTSQEQTNSKKLYSILSSYTKNRPQRVVTTVKEENGLEAYRQLVFFNQPNTKARSLQLHREVMGFRFDKDKTYNENFLKFEELIDEYEKASKEKTSDSFKMGTVIDSVPATVRQHILLNTKDDTTYDDLRTFLTTYENAKRWTQPTTTDLINSGKDHGGQAAMDVSQVKGNYKGKGKWKGKGKDQSKGKGKGGDKGGWSKGGRKGNWKGGRGRGGRFGKGSYKAEEKDTATKAKAKERTTTTRATQHQELATTVRSTATTKHSAESSETWPKASGTSKKMSRAKRQLVSQQQHLLQAPGQLPLRQLPPVQGHSPRYAKSLFSILGKSQSKLKEDPKSIPSTARKKQTTR